MLPPHAALTRSGSMSYDAQSQRVGSSRTKTRLAPVSGGEKLNMTTSPPSAPPRLPPRPAVDRTSSADTASPMSATRTLDTQLPAHDPSGVLHAQVSTSSEHSFDAEVQAPTGEAGLTPVGELNREGTERGHPVQEVSTGSSEHNDSRDPTTEPETQRSTG